MDAEIGPDELRTLIDRTDDSATSTVTIVDIRSPAAYAQGHIPGSENVPLPSLVDNIERFDGNARIVTVCPHGKTSVQAARLIASYEGFDGRIESLGPGLAEWDGPVETGNGSETVDHAGDDEGPAVPF